MSRCTGHCCRAFTVHASPEELKKDYQQWLDWGADNTKPQPRFQDIHFVYPMLIYLGIGRNDKSTSQFVADETTGTHFYTCKHLDKETGDCTIYEHRPRMCREYPYGSPCTYGACTAENRCVPKLQVVPLSEQQQLECEKETASGGR